MKNTKIAITIICCCACLAAGGIFGIKTVRAEENIPELKEQYILGSDDAKDIAIPSKENTQAYITCPSGITYRASDKFTPTEEGKYTITYKTSDSQTEYEETFIVCKKKYYVGSSRSSVSYGYRSYGDYVVDKQGKTVLTSISSTDEFKYSEIIDLKEIGSREAFLEFFVLPEEVGTPDARKIDVTLTDAYDSENFVTISIKKGTAAEAGASWAELNSYITANAADQVPSGLEHGKLNEIEIDGAFYQLHKSDDWGANVVFALPGNPKYPDNNIENVGTQTLKLRFDTQNNYIYANNDLVTALSNEDIYGAGTWKGFTDGKCFLKISASGYNSSAVNLGIVRLGSQSTKDNEEFDGEHNIFKDVTPPEIIIDDEGKFTSYPNGVVGKEYSLFKAEAIDDYSKNVTVDATVYYNYKTQKEMSVDCTGGKFVPFKEGEYTIVYTARDAYRNEQIKKIPITADKDEESAQMKVEPGDFPEDIIVGEDCVIPSPVIVGNRGNAVWRAVAYNAAHGVEYEISSDDRKFFPEYTGEYQITYYVDDYISSVTKTVTIIVGNNEKPVFFESPILPEYMLYGCIYDFPTIKAKIYSSGAPQDVVPEIYVKEDGGEEKKVSFRYASYASSDICVIYRVNNGGNITEYQSKSIPVINCGYGGIYKIEKYFAGEDLIADPQGRYIRFTVKAQAAAKDKASTTFINALQTFDFNISLAAAGNGFNTVNLYLTDMANADVRIKLTYRKHPNGNVYFSVNDGEGVLLEGVSFDDSNRPLSPDLTLNGTCVMPTGETILQLSIDKDLQGRDFGGFTRSMAYLTVELEGITNAKQSAIDILRISGQPISGIYLDNIEPSISANADSGARRQGTKYIIRPVYVADVLDPAVICKMSVTAPDGTYAVSTDGTKLDKRNCSIDATYELLLEQYGNYEISYEAVDMSGNIMRYNYIITSSDMTPPDVQIVAPVTQAKVNESIEIAQIVITDNHDAKEEDFIIYKSVETPQGQTFGLIGKEGEEYSSFIVKSAGEYTVHYLVVDSGGNATHVSYKVTVN